MRSDPTAHPVPTEPATPAEALRGPWFAVLSDNYGELYESIEDFGEGDSVEIAVVRGTAAPTGSRRPGSYRNIDVLYELEDLDDEPQEIADRWAQAQAVAAALNARSTVPGPAPTTWALPDEPGPEAIQVWNDDGDSWCRLVRPLATGQRWVPWDVIDDETHIVEAALHWDELIAEQGRLSSVPPVAEASHG